MLALCVFFSHNHGAAEEPSRSGSSVGQPLEAAFSDPLPARARLRLGTSRFYHPGGAREIALSPDGKTLITAGSAIIAWDTATGRQRWRGKNVVNVGAAYGVRLLAFTADGQQCYAPGTGRDFYMWNLASGKRTIGSFKFPNEQNEQVEVEGEPGVGSKAIDVSPDGLTIALGGAEGVRVGTLKGAGLFKIENHPPLQPHDNDDRLAFNGEFSYPRFSPDGKLLAVVTSDAPDAIRLHDSQTGAELRRIALSAKLVRMEFTSDGRQIVCTERDKAIRLYGIETGKSVWSHIVELDNPYENYTSAVALSPDGKMVAVCATDNRIYLLDRATGDEIGRLVGHHWYPWALAFAPDGRMLYSSGWDGNIRRWDVAARKQIPPPHGVHATDTVAISPDARMVAFADDAGTVHLVDAHSGVEQQQLMIEDQSYSELCFSPDSRRLAAGGTQGNKVQVTLWELSNGAVLQRWAWDKGRDPHSTVESIAFTPDGRCLAACVFRQSAAYVWDVSTGAQVTRVKHNEVYGVAFIPDGKQLASAGWDSSIRFWDAATGAAGERIDLGEKDVWGTSLHVINYAPSAGLFATARLDGQVCIWRADDHTQLAKFQAATTKMSQRGMALSPDGLKVAAGNSSGQIVLWDAVTGQKMFNLGRHDASCSILRFGGDGRTLVTGGDDGVCYVWDLWFLTDTVEIPLDTLWQYLSGKNASVADRAFGFMAAKPERTVELLAGKLRPVKSLFDPDKVVAGVSKEEAAQRDRLQSVLIDKHPETMRIATARRAIALLTGLGTPEAIALLEELTDADAHGELAPLAAAALARIKPAAEK